MNESIKNNTPLGLYMASMACFIFGLTQPIMTTTKLFGWSRDHIYLHSSIQFFWENGEVLIGILLLFFTFIFPILKYVFLAIRLLGIKIRGGKRIGFILELINKWAMLDVFVVAMVIVNLKLDSAIIKTSLNVGTTWFAISILLMMICSLMLSKQEV